MQNKKQFFDLHEMVGHHGKATPKSTPENARKWHVLNHVVLTRVNFPTRASGHSNTTKKEKGESTFVFLTGRHPDLDGKTLPTLYWVFSRFWRVKFTSSGSGKWYTLCPNCPPNAENPWFGRFYPSPGTRPLFPSQTNVILALIMIVMYFDEIGSTSWIHHDPITYSQFY